MPNTCSESLTIENCLTGAERFLVQEWSSYRGISICTVNFGVQNTDKAASFQVIGLNKATLA